MKHFLLLFFSCCFIGVFAQTNTYTINNQTYELKTDVKGTISLLWNTIDKEYIYFAKKGAVIIPLTNTKVQGTFQEEYKTQILQLTADIDMDEERIDRVRLTLSNLRRFFNAYNKEVDPEYIAKKMHSDLEYRLGVFAGITNGIFRKGILSTFEQETYPQFIVDLELYDKIAFPSHGLAIQYKQTLFTGDLEDNDHEFSINHRFKFIKTPKLQVFLNTKMITYTIGKRDFLGPDFIDPSVITVTNLETPFIFGLGTDIKLKRGYLTFQYHDIYSFVIDGSDEFPVDITAGYRFVF